MTSPPLENTHGRQRRAWLDDITALGHHTQSATSGVARHHRPSTTHTVGNFGRGMTSPPLDSTHGRQRRAWHDITTLGLHTRLDNVGRGMPSSPLDSTHDRTTSGVACNHRLWVAHTVERRRAWHAIIALGRQTRSNNVRRGMPSPPLDSIHDRTTSGMA